MTVSVPITAPGKLTILKIGTADFVMDHWVIAGWHMECTFPPPQDGWTPEELHAIAVEAAA